MTDPKAIQQALFQQIRQQLPGHLAVADEVAALLNLSADSAYRRIRGEKLLSFDEVILLSRTFGLSVDGFLQANGNQVLFGGQQIDFANFDLERHLGSILGELQQLASFNPCRMYYLAKDVPVFHYFHFHELAAFKFFAWLKTILHSAAFNTKKFVLGELINDNWQQLSKKIIHTYNTIPSEEIWSAETINSTLRQIEYCREAMLFDHEETVQLLYRQLLLLVHHIEEQAAAGCKFMPGGHTAPGAAFKLYYNGAVLGDNTILMQMGEVQRVYLNHAILNYIHTGHEGFCGYTAASIGTIIKKSTMISTVGEKDRNKFFNTMRVEIERRMQVGT